MNDLKKMENEFKKLKNDRQRWDWVINNQDKNIIVWLDNDSTFVTIEGEEDSPILSFDYYLGWSDGIQILLDQLNIKAECV